MGLEMGAFWLPFSSVLIPRGGGGLKNTIEMGVRICFSYSDTGGEFPQIACLMKTNKQKEVMDFVFLLLKVPPLS